MEADERDIEQERTPGATNAQDSATPYSADRAAKAAGEGHGDEDDRKIDGAADAAPGEDPEGATAHSPPTEGDPLGSAKNPERLD